MFAADLRPAGDGVALYRVAAASVHDASRDEPGAVATGDGRTADAAGPDGPAVSQRLLRARRLSQGWVMGVGEGRGRGGVGRRRGGGRGERVMLTDRLCPNDCSGHGGCHRGGWWGVGRGRGEGERRGGRERLGEGERGGDISQSCMDLISNDLASLDRCK